MTITDNAEMHTAATIFDRHADLTPPEYLTDDAEPFSVQYARVQTQVELWEAVRQYEQQNRTLDAQAVAIERAEARAEQADTDDTAETEARAARRAEQTLADRRSRVHLWASQRGLRYVVSTHTDHHGNRTEQHRLTAPAGHLDLELEPWENATPLLLGSQQVVHSVKGETLESVESWLGLPHDPTASGTPRPSRTPALPDHTARE